MLSLLPWYDGSYTSEKLEPPDPDLKPADVLRDAYVTFGVQFLERYSDVSKDTDSVHVMAPSQHNEERGSQDEQEATLFKGHEDRKALTSVACRMMTSPLNNQQQ